MKCRIAIAKATFNMKRALFSSTLDLELRKKLVKYYIWNIAFYDVETWTLRAVDQGHLKSSKMWCWRRMEKSRWTDHVRNEEVLLRFKEQRNILDETRLQASSYPSLFVRPHWTTLLLPTKDFHEIFHLSIFRNSVEKFQVSLKSYKNNGQLTRRPLYMYIYDNISLSFS